MQLNPLYVLEYFVVIPVIALAVYAAIVGPFLAKKPKWYKWWHATILTIVVCITATAGVIIYAIGMYMPLWVQLGRMPTDVEVYGATTKFIMDRYADVFMFWLLSAFDALLANVVTIAVAIWRKKGIAV